MKIAFVGTHGVGKTTLCYDLAGILKKRLPSVDVVKEVARSCPLPINRETTLEAQSWILHTQIAREIVAAAGHAAVVCDRSVLDNYAYLVAAVGRHEPLESLVASWMPTYDYLFRVPLVASPTPDGVRDTDAAFRREIDALVLRLLREKSLRFHELPAGRRERWLDHVLRVLDLAAPRRRPAAAEPPRQMTLPIETDEG